LRILDARGKEDKIACIGGDVGELGRPAEGLDEG